MGKYHRSSFYKGDEFLQYVFAIVYVESGFNKLAVSHKNAKGLMQLTDVAVQDAIQYCNLSGKIDLHDPIINIRYGTCYLKKLYKSYGEDWDKTLIAYNGGHRQLVKYEKGENIASETANYVLKVKRALKLCME